MKDEQARISFCLLEVLRGYSKFTFKNKDYYFKHFRIYEELKLEEFELDSFKDSLQKGIKGEEQLLEQAYSKGFWTKEEEETISSLKWVIEKAEIAVSKVSDSFTKQAMNQSVQGDKDKLKELEARRSSIISHSAENLAKRKRNSKTLEDNIFVDEKMTKKADRDDLFYLIPMISEKIDELSKKDNMLKMAFDPYFFDCYTAMYRNPFDLLNTDLFNISIWQKNIISYASVLLNKLKNFDMPDDVRRDPIKLYKFHPRQEGDKDNKVTHGLDDLRQKMAKNNGQLTAEDF